MSAGTFRRFLEKRGESLTYTEFTEGSADAYGDTPYTPDATPITIKAIRSDSSETARTMLDPTGQDRAIDVDFIILASAVVDDADDPTTRAPIFTDASGRIYEVIGVGQEGAPVGARRIFCARRTG